MAVVEHDLLEQRAAECHHGPALDLAGDGVCI